MNYSFSNKLIVLNCNLRSRFAKQRSQKTLFIRQWKEIPEYLAGKGQMNLTTAVICVVAISLSLSPTHRYLALKLKPNLRG